MKTRVVIADGNEQFRNELAAALEGVEGVEVVGFAEDGEQALERVESLWPHILVMDLLLAKLDGITVLERLQGMYDRPQVLVTSAFISGYAASAVARLGAKQLIQKPCAPEVVAGSLQRMAFSRTESLAVFLWNGRRDVESAVTNVLHEIGVPAHIKGYQYLREAIIIATEDMDVLNAVTRVLYAQVAKTFQTTTKRVESAIRRAIEIAWDRGDLDTLQRFFGYTVSNTKGKPTNSEFISIVADQIRLWMKENRK